MKTWIKVLIILIFPVFATMSAFAEEAPVPEKTEKSIIPESIEAAEEAFEAQGKEKAVPENNIEQSSAAPQDRASLYANYSARKYRLGPNDIININVLGVEELSKENVRVQPDGKINLSGIGSITATGLTFDELSEVLEDKLSFYVRNPRVVISLEKSRPFLVQVTGAVSVPGSYEINTDTESTTKTQDKTVKVVEGKTPVLSNVLSAAGGINYDADLEHVVITNSYDGESFEVNLLDLLEKGKTKNDVYLMAGDSVHVPGLPTPLAVDEAKYASFCKATFADKTIPVRVIGYVNSPGLVTLDSSESSSLNTAVAEAGGYLGDYPYPPKKVFISRYSNGGKLVTTAVNPMKNDITLMPNDVIYVPEKTRALIGRAFDLINRIASPAGNIASGYNHWTLMFNPDRFDD